MRPEVVGFFHKPTFSVSYLVFDPAACRGLIIDPVLDYDHRSGHTSTGFADALLEDVRRRGIAIDAQRRDNIHIKNGVDEAAFVAMRRARDKTLEAPVLILPALQVNIRGGRLPAPESNGTVYLKIPLNRI
jgi:hypothetical protein